MRGEVLYFFLFFKPPIPPIPTLSKRGDFGSIQYSKKFLRRQFMPHSTFPADSPVEQLLDTAREFHRNGKLQQAMNAYQAILERQPDNADAQYLLGLVIYRLGNLKQAEEHILHAIALQPEHALAHAGLAQVYQDQGDHKRAVLFFHRAAELEPENSVMLNGLGLSLSHMGQLKPALAAISRAVELKPEMPELHNNLGNLYRSLGDLQEAEKSYRSALVIQPDFIQALNNLGVVYQQQQKSARAIEKFSAAIRLNDNYAEAHNNLGAALNDLGDTGPALVHFQKAIEINPAFVEAAINAGMIQQNLGQHELARTTLDRVIDIEPDNLTALWARCVSELETVYPSTEAIEVARRAYQSRMMALLESTDLGDTNQRSRAAAAVGSLQPFLLPYQGFDDCSLQSLYGDFICQAMRTESIIPLPESRLPGPIRVGIVSSFFYDHSNWKVPIQGWMKSLRSQFELFAYHTGVRQDQVTAEAKALSAHFYSGLSGRQFSELIQNDAIDLLIYPEIGMHPLTTWLATQRLATVQCVSWGHPVTSGLPSMDYFLSSDLMETESSDACYRETLIRLPGLSFNWTPPAHENAKVFSREHFGLKQDEIVFLCVQNLSKYLPQHDHLLAEIARQVPQSRLVFIEAEEATNRLFRQRLQICFEKVGVNADQQILFLPRLKRDEYHALNLLADVFLDTPQWSGCNSSLEALFCDLPIVTLPGDFMRGRHTTAFYRKMQYKTLIAENEARYIELAVRLALDKDWREKQRQQVSNCKHRLIEDDEPVQALAEFIRRQVQS
jgi:predicted O-linked N-acetylglucosamine transferase (SPINDLY family)